MSEIAAITSFFGCGPHPVVGTYVCTYVCLRICRNVIFSQLCAANLMFFKLCVKFCLPSIISVQFNVLLHICGFLWAGQMNA